MIRKSLLVFSCAVFAAGVSLTAQPAPTPVVDTTKPWTRWWWPGSAVDRAGLTAQLEKLAAAGIGGVEITPIYGARGYEERYLEFLSPRYLEMLEHTAREAQRLGLGVDMATGTGWPFGGPWVAEADGNTRAVLVDGRLAGRPERQLVKRAAPGGAGLVLDPFSPEALNRYLARFDEAFATFPRGLLRSQFHDSFEYYNASFSPRLPEVFQAMHGYDVQTYAAELMGEKPLDPDTLGRIKSDYRLTLAQMHLDYLKAWTAWSGKHGFLTRNQSHGAPANLLDLYAAVDIPETEIFGSTPFPIPGLRRDPDAVRHDQDLPEPLVSRMASSAAHVMGRKLISSETATWLRDHWKESLAYVKPELDRVLLDGINHVFYHGTVYSPPDVPWPGWLFYASTQFNPNNPWWDDLAALNQYVQRVQTVLQGGRPDNDVLLYWPAADLWDDTQARGLAKMLTVHSVGFLLDQPVGKLAKDLDARGFAFDYISDAQILATKVEQGALVTPGNRYRTLVVPATRRMPVDTLRHLLALADGGATIVFSSLPEDVPGFGRLEERRAEFRRLLDRLTFVERDGRRQAAVGRGRVLLGDEAGALQAVGAAREAFADLGLAYIRRATEHGRDYFIANLGATPVEGWVTLGAPVARATLVDPLTGRRGLAAQRAGAGGATQVYLHLTPGESLLLVSTPADPLALPPAWAYLQPAGDGIALQGQWSITFQKGGPELPPALSTSTLASWTDLGGDEAKRFSGTARYRLEFDAPAGAADAWRLDLGDVRDSARVRLNGEPVATAWSLPFRVLLDGKLRPGRNVLEIEVTNLAANRIRDMDIRKVDWKIMHEINFVNINYRRFDASGWKIEPSGLLGPVTLVPLRRATL